MPTPTTPRASERAPDTIVLVHGFWLTPRSWEAIPPIPEEIAVLMRDVSAAGKLVE